MKIVYIFRSGDQTSSFDVELDRASSIMPPDVEWEALNCHQCEGCPLSGGDQAVCPPARDMLPLIKEFGAVSPTEMVSVEVVTPDRSYSKETQWKEGLQSLIGLVLATSLCPVLGSLKAGARFHLPFASPAEFVMRSASVYLLKQHFVRKSGEVPDWDFVRLREFNAQLQGLNQSLWQRFHKADAGEAVLEAILGFFEMASAMSHGLELHLQKIRPFLD